MEKAPMEREPFEAGSEYALRSFRNEYSQVRIPDDYFIVPSNLLEAKNRIHEAGMNVGFDFITPDVKRVQDAEHKFSLLCSQLQWITKEIEPYDGRGGGKSISSPRPEDDPDRPRILEEIKKARKEFNEACVALKTE